MQIYRKDRQTDGCQNIYKKLYKNDKVLTIKSIMRSPLAFFNTTPSGRILNRFSKDMDECKYIFIGKVLYEVQ